MVKSIFLEKNNRYKEVAFITTVILCVFLPVLIYINFGIEIVYTHFFYLPIILTGLWYSKKTLWMAGFLGILQITVNFFQAGYFGYSSIIPATTYMLAAGMVGALAMERDELNAQLIVHEPKFRLMSEAMLDVIGRINDAGHFKYVSPSVEKILGYRVNEIEKLNIFQIVHQGDIEIVKEKFQNAIAGNEPVNMEFRCIHKDGSVIWIEYIANPMNVDDSNSNEYVFACRDISERKAADEKINNLAITDSLTGLKNRRFLDAVMETEVERAKRYHQKISVAMLDLDRFKVINDTYGHPVGDEVLKQVAEIAKSTIRKSDFIARLGGEEFMILLPQTDVYGAFEIAEKIRKAIEDSSHPVAGKVTASFGVAEKSEGETVNDIYKRVDDALYRAKEGGRNRVVMHEGEEIQPIGYANVNWNKDWESGDQGVDEQHRELVQMANKLIYLSFLKSSEEETAESLTALLKHIVDHFAYEEAVQIELGYPGYMEHAEIHKDLVGKALSLKKSSEQGTLKPSEMFAFILDDVVVGHMLYEDVKFFPYTKPQSAGTK